jgi:S-adenosylmethionine-diacylgycerolhomoserine-N-methlytransferase
MGFFSDLRTLWHMTFTRVRGDDPAERLEAFYRPQARGYDAYRRRLLHGRAELMGALDLPAGGRLLDLGGGTGSNLEHLGDRLATLGRVAVVDLSPSLLQVAARRVQRHGWRNVSVVLADATTYEPESGPVDAVTFSYSLTMIPDWFKAIDHAHALLKPGGVIGVVDFYVARKWPAPGLRRHSRFQRWFWPWLFSWDNVFLSPDHLPYLLTRFKLEWLAEGMGPVPYLFGLQAPYYLFVGKKV